MIGIGKKIQYFRKRAQLSQMELEVGINASVGSISRIENNKVIPTKETIEKISLILNLNPLEHSHLIGKLANPATERDEELIREKYFDFMHNKNNFAYIADDRWNLVEISSNLSKFLKCSGSKSTISSKTSLIEFILSKEYMYDIFCKEQLRELLEIQLSIFEQEVGFMIFEKSYKRNIRLIQSNPLANEIWEKIKNDKLKVHPNIENRKVYIKFNNKDYCINFIVEQCLDNSRFRIIQYSPPQEFIEEFEKTCN